MTNDTIDRSIKKRINPLYAFITLLILAFVPLFGYYSITCVKDTLYTAFLVLWTLRMYDYLSKYNHTKKDYLILLIIQYFKYLGFILMTI